MRLPNPYRPEATVLAHRLAALEGALNWPAVITASAPWVQAVRDNPPPFWAMESLLKEYPISSAEGLALMRLAEALLRVPDAETAMALTADQLGRADFDGGEHASHAAHGDGAHEGISRSTLARLSSSAIALSKKFLPDPTSGEQPGLFTRLGARTVVAATLRSVQLLGRQFVLGQTIGDAQKEAASARKKQAGLRFSYDMLGEGARTEADAQAYLASYTQAISAIANKSSASSDTAENDGISIKLSALHPRYEDAQTQRVLTELVPRVWTLCQQAARANINLTIDAEEVDRLELSLRVFEALAERVAAECPQWSGFGLALQAYQTRALELVEHVIAVARQHRIRLMCRLVKGAYWDAEIKRAQELGLAHYPVFTEKHHTDASYLACARALLAAPDAIYPQFATHNAGTIAAILQMAGSATPVAGLPTGGTEAAVVAVAGGAATQGSVQEGSVSGSRFELQRLHGMGEGIYREVLKHPAVRCRVYAPVGQHRDLLAYLVRRLLENGANSSFVHQLADESVGMDVLLASPMDQSAGFAASAQPPLNLPLPPDLFGPARRNSTGLDLTVAAHRDPLLAAHAQTSVPVVPEFDTKLASDAYQKSADSYQQWSATPVEQRAAILRAAADALEADTPRFCALLVKEAHKTWGDTVAEVREAVDFLRYYAAQAERIMQPIELPEVDSLWGMSASMGAGQVWGAQDSPQGRPKANQLQGVGAVGAAQPAGQAWGAHFKGWGVTGERNTLRLTARGVWVAISPWNFPLAIFLGQVAAALATGNTVLAKPAEQTPAVALEAVRLLHAAGVPADALQLLHGPGETVGAALVALPGVAGVVFTGSTQVAKLIQRALAAKDGPIVPLIAETGGLNAMLVDSTALPEQVADAVVQSAFRSAGQRCSALRLLCVHEAVADGVLHMIAGAAQELRVGNPAELATDVGPLIDAEAFEGISRHVARLKKVSKSLLSLDGIDLSAMPNLMPPQMFEVAGVGAVGDEIFGPVLQVVRWGPGCAGLESPEAVVRAINALGAPGGPAGATAGYGLTFGIQTRIDSRAQALARAAHIGNVYVNRNMIGAVVGLQPFGGEGLSGTGPKAGGPHYLYRFCAEQTVTINTTAAGGNVALLA